MTEQELQEARNQRINILIGMIEEQPYDKTLDPFKLAECVICFEEFQTGVNVRRIPICQHVFHSKCIEDWFRAKL
jgi:RING-like zinc finger